MPVAIGSHTKTQREETAAQPSLEDVRKALRQHGSSLHLFTAMDAREIVASLLVCMGLFALAELSLFGALQEHRSLVALSSAPTITVELSESAAETQIHSLLQGMLSLSHVASVQYETREQQLAALQRQVPEALIASDSISSFTDRASIRLRSFESTNAFFAFLKSPELHTILAPSFLWDVPEQIATIQSSIDQHRSTRLLFLGGTFLSLAMMIVLGWQYLRMRMSTLHNQLSTLRQLGARSWSLYKPFVFELSLFIVVGVSVSSVIVAGMSPLLF